MPDIIFPSELPDFPADNEQVATDFMHLFGIMSYPRDESAQDKVMAAVTAGNVKKSIAAAQEYVRKAGRGAVNVSGELATALFAAPDMDSTIDEAASRSAFGGHVAGMILGWCVFRYERPETRASASLGAAFSMIEAGCVKGGMKGGSRENLKKNLWPAFRPAAHLWAAFQLWSDRGVDLGKTLNPEHMLHFLMSAEWFRQKGEALVPPRGRAPILQASETWKIRDEVSREWQTMEIQCADLDAWDLRKRAKPRQSLRRPG